MKKNDEYIRQLLQTQDGQLKKLHLIVQSAIEEETLLSNKLVDKEDDITLTFGAKLSDRVAAFGGSWKFIVIFAIVLFVWILFNTLAPNNKDFDPYPFILMNLILSCIAALQAPVIMMSQNRKEEKDRKRAENDYLINLKAEVEIRNLHQKIDLSIVDQFQHLCNIQQKQLEMLEMLEMLDKKMDQLQKSKSEQA
ncbi:MAG: DUF1003 domain-containing protein [Ferruginibacter sp.]